MPSDLAVDHGKEVLRLIGVVGQAFRKTLPNIIRIGELLIEQKKALPHGQFLPWLEKHGIQQRSARNYMWAYKHKGDPKLASATNLTEAKRLLCSPKSAPSKSANFADLPPNPLESNGSTESEPEIIETEGETVPPDPPIDTTDPVFAEEPEPEPEPLSIQEIVARSGLKPVNWTSPEGPRELDTHRTETARGPEVNPIQYKRDALPESWVELLYEIKDVEEDKKVRIDDVLAKLVKRITTG